MPDPDELPTIDIFDIIDDETPVEDVFGPTAPPVVQPPDPDPGGGGGPVIVAKYRLYALEGKLIQFEGGGVYGLQSSTPTSV